VYVYIYSEIKRRSLFQEDTRPHMANDNPFFETVYQPLLQSTSSLSPPENGISTQSRKFCYDIPSYSA